VYWNIEHHLWPYNWRCLEVALVIKRSYGWPNSRINYNNWNMYFEKLIALCEARLLMLMAKHKFRGNGTWRRRRQQARKLTPPHLPPQCSDTHRSIATKYYIYIYIYIDIVCVQIFRCFPYPSSSMPAGKARICMQYVLVFAFLVKVPKRARELVKESARWREKERERERIQFPWTHFRTATNQKFAFTLTKYLDRARLYIQYIGGCNLAKLQPR